jgi:hypothetical protein
MRVDANSPKTRGKNRIQCANVIFTGATCAYGFRRSYVVQRWRRLLRENCQSHTTRSFVVLAERPGSAAPQLSTDALAASGGGSKAFIALLGMLTCYSNLYTDLKWVRDVEIRAEDVEFLRFVG